MVINKNLVNYGNFFCHYKNILKQKIMSELLLTGCLLFFQVRSETHISSDQHIGWPSCRCLEVLVILITSAIFNKFFSENILLLSFVFETEEFQKQRISVKIFLLPSAQQSQQAFYIPKQSAPREGEIFILKRSLQKTVDCKNLSARQELHY